MSPFGTRPSTCPMNILLRVVVYVPFWVHVQVVVTTPLRIATSILRLFGETKIGGTKFIDPEDTWHAEGESAFHVFSPTCFVSSERRRYPARTDRRQARPRARQAADFSCEKKAASNRRFRLCCACLCEVVFLRVVRAPVRASLRACLRASVCENSHIFFYLQFVQGC